MKADEESFYKTLGNKIASERNRFGITQEKLAVTLDLSRVSVVNIEKGKQKPSIFQLFLIAEKFNLTLDTLISGYQLRKELPNSEIVHGREIDKRSMMEFNSFLNKIKI